MITNPEKPRYRMRLSKRWAGQPLYMYDMVLLRGDREFIRGTFFLNGRGLRATRAEIRGEMPA